MAPGAPARWLWCWAMAELQWTTQPILFLTFIIAAGTLAANSSILHHCAYDPNSGSGFTWGLNGNHDSPTQVDSAYLPFNMVADDTSVESNVSLTATRTPIASGPRDADGLQPQTPIASQTAAPLLQTLRESCVWRARDERAFDI